MSDIIEKGTDHSPQTIILVRSNSQSLAYHRFTSLGCKDIGIKNGNLRRVINSQACDSCHLETLL